MREERGSERQSQKEREKGRERETSSTRRGDIYFNILPSTPTVHREYITRGILFPLLLFFYESETTSIRRTSLLPSFLFVLIKKIRR